MACYVGQLLASGIVEGLAEAHFALQAKRVSKNPEHGLKHKKLISEQTMKPPKKSLLKRSLYLGI